MATSNAYISRLKDEHEQLLSMIGSVVVSGDEPITSDEVQHVLQAAYGITYEDTTIFNALRKLVELGELYRRVETTEERTLRHGGIKYGRGAYLYSVSNPVPPRTLRAPVGLVAQPTLKPAPRPRDEVTRELFIALRNKIRRGRFTAGQLAVNSTIDVETVRRRLNRLVEQGVLRSVKPRKVGGNVTRVYSIPAASEQLIRARANGVEPEPVRPSTSSHVFSIVDLAGDSLNRVEPTPTINEAVERIVKAIEAERNDAALDRIAELEMELAEANRKLEQFRALAR